MSPTFLDSLRLSENSLASLKKDNQIPLEIILGDQPLLKPVDILKLLLIFLPAGFRYPILPLFSDSF